MAVHNAAAFGLCAVSCGDLAAAIDQLERARAEAEAEGLGNPSIVPFAGDLAEALARGGPTERAELVLAWLQARASTTGLAYPQAAAVRARGILAPDPAAALAWFAQGPLDVPEAADSVRAGSHSALRGRGSAPRPPCCSSLAPLARLAIFNGLGAQPWADRLASTGAQVGARTALAGRALDALGPQELQVARAVA